MSIALILTHGASANCQTRLLVALGDAFAASGFLVHRFNLAFRVKRPHGPPSPSQSHLDRESIREAVAKVRSLGATRVIAGGHSYGGRQTTMAAAEDAMLADGLLLLSYPLHPPGKHEQLRTAHFPALRTKSLFVHGAKDPFGSEEEMREAIKQIPAPSELLMVGGAGHDLGRNPAKLAAEVVERASRFLLS